MTIKRTRAEWIAYLKQKVGEEDWAAVREVAEELRTFDILEARSPAPKAAEG